ncbi:2OG-Fe(II) oxygenase [Planktomarina temperata]|nr:2OG-Fe(II) oxygenase [Planktomarina temperata]
MPNNIPMKEILNLDSIEKQIIGFGGSRPFDHVVIDNFFNESVAIQLSEEFPDFDSEIWHKYDNAIEVKKTCNNWNLFPKKSYTVFSFLNSGDFSKYLSDKIFGGKKLYSDPGLNGGGWHIHKQGGKLNTHLDYSLHPKLSLQRKFNIIIYLNPNWQSDWGGALGLWSGESSERPGDLEKVIDCKFNRAVIFDTTQNSWHGLPDPVVCPKSEARKSLAVYYLCNPVANIDPRGKALFAPTREQEDDHDVLQLIKDRASLSRASSTYTDTK